jgi:hypothetical protein
VTVLERQPDAEMPFQRTPHGVIGQGPQQLAACRLVGRRDLIVGKALAGQRVRQPADH